MNLLILAMIVSQAPPLELVQHANDPTRRLIAGANISDTNVKLSGELRLTLTVEGPAPLDVTIAKPLLVTAPLWRVRDDGQPIREVISPNRQRWSRQFRLSPLVNGNALIQIAPLTVRCGTMGDQAISLPGEWNVRVTSSIATPSKEELRPGTGMETVAPPVVAEETSSWRIVIVPVLLLAALITIKLAKRRRPAGIIHDSEWAKRELETESADQCARVLRLFVSHTFGVPATKQTTPEIVASIQTIETFPTRETGSLESILTQCDTLRFAPSTQNATGLVQTARGLIDRLHQSQLAKLD